MGWLLDTHALLWVLFEPEKLGKKTREIVKNPANEVWVSPVSYWEISLKYGLGKLILPGTNPSEIPAAVGKLGLAEAALDPEILATLHLLPYAPDHRDPFDRMIVWQAIHKKLVLVSKDRALAFFKSHGLKTEW